MTKHSHLKIALLALVALLLLPGAGTRARYDTRDAHARLDWRRQYRDAQHRLRPLQYGQRRRAWSSSRPR